MNNEQLWNKFCKENPEFETNGFNFSSRGLKKFFDLVYSQAYKHGEESVFESAGINRDHNNNKSGNYDMPDFFKDLFTEKHN